MTKRTKVADLEPHPITLAEPKRTAPAKQPKRQLDAPHTGRAVKNCRCICCQEHRRLNRQALRDRALAAMADVALHPMNVQVGENASQALREALGAD